jgi:hypothetical protein
MASECTCSPTKPSALGCLVARTGVGFAYLVASRRRRVSTLMMPIAISGFSVMIS